jgi:hypothetical protein
MRATSKHLQIQGRSAKLIFILQMHRNIVSLFKRFGRRVFQSRTSSSCKTLPATVDTHMASTKKLHGLPNNLVQQFFSTLFYYDKGYMADWIWNTATQNNVESVDIDIINGTVTPTSVQIKPIVSQLDRLRDTIKAVLTSNEFPVDFIVKANLYVKLSKDSKTQRFLEVKGVAVDKNGKVYEGQVYSEQAYEDIFSKSFLDSLKDLFKRT